MKTILAAAAGATVGTIVGGWAVTGLQLWARVLVTACSVLMP